jgi:hypothetical protein
MRRVVLGLALVTLLVFALAGTAAAQSSTLLSDDYEGAVKWAANSSGWNMSTTYASSPTHSAHTPSYMGGTLIYGPFDLSSATAARLDFELWYYAPTIAGSATTYGSFCVGYSTGGGSITYPFQWSGDTWGEWWSEGFDLSGWSLLGEPEVWIAFTTTQWNAMAYSQGAYVDDLTLTATIADTAPPTTTASGALTGRWYRGAVTVSLSGRDEEGGSGLDYTEYSLDGGIWTPGDAIEVSSEGPHTLLYRSADLAGNTETEKSLTFGIDTRKPTSRAAYAASARRGTTATLRYKVVDPRPGSPTASVTIKIRNKAGKVVKTLGPVVKGVNIALTRRFTVPRTWKAATYRFSIYAKDKAGNTQTLPVGSNRLVVK